MEDKIKEIFKQLYKDKMSLEEAEQQVLDLFAVSGSLPTEFEIGNQAVNYAGYKTRASGNRIAFVAGAEWMKQKLVGNDR